MLVVSEQCVLGRIRKYVGRPDAGQRTLGGALNPLGQDRIPSVPYLQPRESPIQGHRSGDESSGKLYEASGAWRKG